MAEESLVSQPKAMVIVVDDDEDLMMSVSRLLLRNDYQVQSFMNAEQLLENLPDTAPNCVLTDVMMDHVDGFNLAEKLNQIFPATALIFMTAWPNVNDAVSSFQKYKGVNYLQKPMKTDTILAAVEAAVAWSLPRVNALSVFNQLSAREREVLMLLSKGHGNKQIAFKLDLSQKTIEYHRASMLGKIGTSDLPHLYQLCRLVEDL